MTHHRASYRPHPPYRSPAMNHYRDQAASTSQLSLSTDVPDLYYEQGYRTPSSVTSSDMLSTPPRYLRTPWMPDDVRENGASYMSSWQSIPMDSCQSKRPIVAPINTNFNWSLRDTTESSSMPFTSNGEFNPAHQVAGGYRSSYPHTFVDNDPTMSFSLTVIPGSSALSASLPPITPSSSIPDPYTIPAPSHPPATRPNQAPLKLHQPRPSRRIPIISLSNLASACDDFATTHVKEPKRHATEESLSLDFNRVSSLSTPAVDGDNTHHLKYMLYSTSDVYSPMYGVGVDGHSGKAILCNCGCMESYTFR
jgi:hypothetical protein